MDADSCPQRHQRASRSRARQASGQYSGTTRPSMTSTWSRATSAGSIGAVTARSIAASACLPTSTARVSMSPISVATRGSSGRSSDADGPPDQHLVDRPHGGIGLAVLEQARDLRRRGRHGHHVGARELERRQALLIDRVGIHDDPDRVRVRACGGVEHAMARVVGMRVPAPGRRRRRDRTAPWPRSCDMTARWQRPSRTAWRRWRDPRTKMRKTSSPALVRSCLIAVASASYRGDDASGRLITSGPFSAVAHNRPMDRSTRNAPSRPRVATWIAPASSSRPMATWIDAMLDRCSRASSLTVGRRDGGSGTTRNRRASSGHDVGRRTRAGTRTWTFAILEHSCRIAPTGTRGRGRRGHPTGATAGGRPRGRPASPSHPAGRCSGSRATVVTSPPGSPSELTTSTASRRILLLRVAVDGHHAAQAGARRGQQPVARVLDRERR